MFKLRLIFFFLSLMLSGAMQAQGILDSIVSQNIEEPEDVEVVQPINNYPYYQYKKDSVDVKILHDSLAKIWSSYDSVPPKKNRIERFSRTRNNEILKAKKRPLIFTISYLVILLSISIYWMFFRNKFIQSLTASVRGFSYKEMYIDQLKLLDFNIVFFKLIVLILYGLVLNFVLLKLNWVLIENINLQFIAVLLIVIVLAILKYFLGLILAVLFENQDLLKHHFMRNIVYDAVVLIPLLISITVAYFTQNQQVSSVFYMISCFIYALNVALTFAIFGGFVILEYSNKKLFVIFYLCTLEIIPILLLARWLAISYL